MIRGTQRPTNRPSKLINVEIDANIHNRFDIEVIDSLTGKIKQRAQAKNVICAALWTKMFTPTAWFKYIHYGTGSGTPSSADASLFTFLGAIAPTFTDDAIGFEEGVFWFKRKIQLSETMHVGSVLSEVGIGYSNTASTICTHAMLKDMNGNSITITKTSTDIINIYATVFVHWSVTDPYVEMQYNASLSNGNESQYSGGFFELAGNLSNYGYGISGRLPDAAQLLSSNISQYNASTLKAITKTYNAAAKTITLTCARFAVAEGNVANNLCVLLGCGNYDNMIYWPFLRLNVGGTWFPGSSITNEAIGTGDGITKDFATDFAFVQSGAKIYFDGVEQTTGVTIDTDVPFIAIPAHGLIQCRLIDGNLYPAGRYGNRDSVDYVATFTGDNYFYNSLYASDGVAQIYAHPIIGSAYCSDDLVTWITLPAPVSYYITVPSEYRSYKYWKITQGSQYNIRFVRVRASNNNIHFANAPASGVVITADYTSKTVAKDTNHVFDLTVVLTIGEYTA